jgi:hypothetical protein
MNATPLRVARIARPPTDVTLGDDHMRQAKDAAGSMAHFVLQPGVVAGLVPWWLSGWRVRQPLPSWARAPLKMAGMAAVMATRYQGLAGSFCASWEPDESAVAVAGEPRPHGDHRPGIGPHPLAIRPPRRVRLRPSRRATKIRAARAVLYQPRPGCGRNITTLAARHPPRPAGPRTSRCRGPAPPDRHTPAPPAAPQVAAGHPAPSRGSHGQAPPRWPDEPGCHPAPRGPGGGRGDARRE